MACVGGSGAKGQSEHESVEMPVGLTMRFLQLLLKDRALLPADKTFRLNTRSCGSQLSWGFPNRPCGHEFHPFPDSSWNSHPFIFPICLLLFLPLRCFSSLCDSHEKCVHICRLFFHRSHFLSRFPLCCGLKPKSTDRLIHLPPYICWQLSNKTMQLSPHYSLIIRLGALHPLFRQDVLVTKVRGSQRWRHYYNFIINSSQPPNLLMCFGYVNIKVSYTKNIGQLNQRPGNI